MYVYVTCLFSKFIFSHGCSCIYAAVLFAHRAPSLSPPDAEA